MSYEEGKGNKRKLYEIPHDKLIIYVRRVRRSSVGLLTDAQLAHNTQEEGGADAMADVLYDAHQNTVTLTSVKDAGRDSSEASVPRASSASRSFLPIPSRRNVEAAIATRPLSTSSSE